MKTRHFFGSLLLVAAAVVSAGCQGKNQNDSTQANNPNMLNNEPGNPGSPQNIEGSADSNSRQSGDKTNSGTP